MVALTFAGSVLAGSSSVPLIGIISLDLAVALYLSLGCDCISARSNSPHMKWTSLVVIGALTLPDLGHCGRGLLRHTMSLESTDMIHAESVV